MKLLTFLSLIMRINKKNSKSSGAKLNVWGRIFVITGADRYVLSFAEENEERVTPQLLNSLKNLFIENEVLPSEVNNDVDNQDTEEATVCADHQG